MGCDVPSLGVALHRGLVQNRAFELSDAPFLLESLLLAGCCWPAAATAACPDRPGECTPVQRSRLFSRHRAADTLTLPNDGRSIKFAVIGDSGRGSKEQHDVAAQMEAYRQRFDYQFVLMAGDNIYEGPASAEDYRLKFEEPYKPLLDAGVKFYAALGNHDDTNQIYYKPFNMDGHRYYTFVPPVDPITRWDTRVRFFALDSTYLDREQIALAREGNDGVDARSGRSRSCIIRSTRRAATRWRHAAFASRSSRLSSTAASTWCSPDTSTSTSAREMQQGILYFVTGGAGSLREGDAQRIAARSRAATIATITSCWWRSRTTASSSRRSIALGVTIDAGVAEGGLLRTRRTVGDLLDLALERVDPLVRSASP